MRAPASTSRSNRSASVSVTERVSCPCWQETCWKPGAGVDTLFAVVAGPWCASEPCNGLCATVDRPRALTGAIVSRGGASRVGSRTCNNLLSLNPCYIYSMTNVTCRRPFGELGDQQLLDQAKRLAANQRSLEVHILDHLDEIDRRGLALRRGFSSLFDYATSWSICKYCNVLLVVPIFRYCYRNPWRYPIILDSLPSGVVTREEPVIMTVNGADRSFATASPTCRCAPTVVDDTVIVHGRLAVVVVLLPREPGPRLRAHPQYEAPRRRCRCPGCRAGYARTALTAMCQRQRSARQSQARHSRCAWRRDREPLRAATC